MHRFLTIIFASLFNVFMRFVCGSNRLTVTGQDVFERYGQQGGNIYAFWHNRLFYLAHFYVRRVCGRKLTMLVSMSRDGDYGAAVVRKLGQDAVRGSSSRGGPQAVRKLVTKIAGGGDVAITPDGPRGPAFTVNEGVIKLAQVTGARIIPVSFDASRRRQLKSWDRFIILKPFGRVHVAIGEPIEIPRKTTSGDRELYRRQLEERLHELDRVCRDHLTSGPGEQLGASRGPLTQSVR